MCPHQITGNGLLGHGSHLPGELQEEAGNKRHWAAESELGEGNAALAWYFEGHGTVLR